jgi:hypothetical protein
MLRCERCGGGAQAGLAHIHGDPSRHLCWHCTMRLLEQRDQERQKGRFQAELQRCLKRVLPRAA